MTFPEGPKQSLNRSSSTKDTLPQIPFSKNELEGLQKSIGGSLFLDSAATRHRFWEEAPKHQIIHLSTHAWLNEEDSDFSFIALAPEDSGTNHHKVYVKELYNLDLEADMVVLSACETGLGKLYQGEGMLSVARGFSYAGARSIVNTLWSVNDKATSSLILAFYEFLGKHQPKDVALNNARSAYLKTVIDKAYAHPYYWAAAVPIGNMEPIELPQNLPLSRNSLIIGLSLATLILISTYMWTQKRKSKRGLI